MTSLATIVVRRPSRATSLAQAVRYKMKIPEARERALSESLEMLVDFGRVCLRRRRMQAAGGSKSEEFEAGCFVAAAAAAVDFCSVEADVADAAGGSSIAAAEAAMIG